MSYFTIPFYFFVITLSKSPLTFLPTSFCAETGRPYHIITDKNLYLLGYLLNNCLTNGALLDLAFPEIRIITLHQNIEPDSGLLVGGGGERCCLVSFSQKNGTKNQRNWTVREQYLMLSASPTTLDATISLAPKLHFLQWFCTCLMNWTVTCLSFLVYDGRSLTEKSASILHKFES